jgi:hypothetical protein
MQNGIANAGRIRKFKEKPSQSELEQFRNAAPEDVDPVKPFQASMGVYVFKREVLESLLHKNEVYPCFPWYCLACLNTGHGIIFLVTRGMAQRLCELIRVLHRFWQMGDWSCGSLYELQKVLPGGFVTCIGSKKAS